MATEAKDSEGEYLHAGLEKEAERQETMAREANLATRRLFEDAGIGSGMRVLELGSGAGDVALVAAELVGPAGSVLGIEVNPVLAEAARERVRRARLTNVSFVLEDLRTFEPEGDFDAIVGRFVLMHVPTRTQVLRSLLRRLRPGGIVAFQELQALPSALTLPGSPLIERAVFWVQEASRRLGVEMSMGLRLHEVFSECGLHEVHLRARHAMDHVAEHEARVDLLVAGLRDLLPRIVEHGIATEEEVGIDTLEERLRAEYVDRRVVSLAVLDVDAWARKP
jgi:ubiquinone/menaquinone biosynthesis C-methylase UbiE